MKDESPSSEDIERFGGDTAYCPSCGEEIWDDAEVCPACHQPIIGGHASRKDRNPALQRRVTIVIVILLILGLLACYRWIV